MRPAIILVNGSIGGYDFLYNKSRPTLDAGAVGRILSEFIDTTDWMPRLHSRAEDIGFAGTMIDRGWVRVFEGDTILGFIARSDEEVCALYVARAARGQGIGTALLNDAKQVRQSLKL